MVAEALDKQIFGSAVVDFLGEGTAFFEAVAYLLMRFEQIDDHCLGGGRLVGGFLHERVIVKGGRTARARKHPEGTDAFGQLVGGLEQIAYTDSSSMQMQIVELWAGYVPVIAVRLDRKQIGVAQRIGEMLSISG